MSKKIHGPIGISATIDAHTFSPRVYAEFKIMDYKNKTGECESGSLKFDEPDSQKILNVMSHGEASEFLSEKVIDGLQTCYNLNLKNSDVEKIKEQVAVWIGFFKSCD